MENMYLLNFTNFSYFSRFSALLGGDFIAIVQLCCQDAMFSHFCITLTCDKQMIG